MSSKKIIKKKETLTISPDDLKVRRAFRVGTAFVERKRKKDKHKKDWMHEED